MKRQEKAEDKCTNDIFQQGELWLKLMNNANLNIDLRFKHEAYVKYMIFSVILLLLLLLLP